MDVWIQVDTLPLAVALARLSQLEGDFVFFEGFTLRVSEENSRFGLKTSFGADPSLFPGGRRVR